MDKFQVIKEFFEPQQKEISLFYFLKEKFNLTFPDKIIRKFIRKGHVKINNNICADPEKLVVLGDKVFYSNITETRRDITSDGVNVDELYLFIVNTLNNTSTLFSPDQTNNKLSFALIVFFIQNSSYESIINSKFNREYGGFLSEIVQTQGLREALNLSRNETKGTRLADKLVTTKLDQENKLIEFLKEVNQGFYDNQLPKFMQKYSKLVKNKEFEWFIEPLMDSGISSRIAIENLVKPIIAIQEISNQTDKFQHYHRYKEEYFNYRHNLLKGNAEYSERFFLPLCEHLEVLYKNSCEIIEEQTGDPEITLADRRYNTNNEELEILFNIINKGNGFTNNTNVSIKDNGNFKGEQIDNLKFLQAGEIRSFSLICSKINSESFRPVIEIVIEWENVNGEKMNKNFSLPIEVQTKEIPWDIMRKKNPYSIRKISTKEKLYGRDEILEELRGNVLSDNIESYKIWGQKRVGKSSIVLTLKSLLEFEENVITVYKEVSRNVEPIKTLNELGASLCSELLGEILNKLKDNYQRDRIREIEIPFFDGSLQPLEDYLKKIRQVNNSLKFVFILDEFDRLNEEFFLPGNIGETFSLSIGKQLSGNDFIGFILVGAENMSLLDYQEINYNSFSDERVDTFNKSKDFNAYLKIITGPVEPYINFSDKAVDLIYEASNGNPYFTNLICAQLFKDCYNKKDSEVDFVGVQTAINLIVDSEQKGHFAHFWGDGLNENSETKREKTTDIRRRILVSYSNYYFREKNFPTKEDLIRTFNYPDSYSILKDEVESKITSFFTRRIFYHELNSLRIRIKPLIFEEWLCGKGRTLIIEGVTDLEAQERENELEEAAKIKEDELSRIREKFRFKSKLIPTDQFKNYFSQFGLNTDQRKIFNLIDNIYYISQEEITDFVIKEQKFIYGSKEIYLGEKNRQVFREGVEIYSSSNVIKETEGLFESFKTCSKIRKNKTLKNLKNDQKYWISNSADTIVFLQPLLANIDVFKQELKIFLEQNKNALIEKEISLVVVSFIITKRAKNSLIKLLQDFSKAKFVSLIEMEKTDIAPFIEGGTIFENNNESQASFSVVKGRIPFFNKDSVLVLFENLCPSDSLPILWKKTKQFTPIFLNENAIDLESITETKYEELRRERVYKANTFLSQNLNSYIINFLLKKSEDNNWEKINLVPKKVLEKVNVRYLSENQMNLKETYLDFIDYKGIINMNNELQKIFSLKGENLSWLEKMNELRRSPAHPEKPAPFEEDVLYFESITEKIVERIKGNPLK